MFSADLSVLVNDVASPDPHVRDHLAYPQLAARIRTGQVSDEELIELGQVMVDRLRDEQIEARTFAALILARIAEEDTWHPDWARMFLDWWICEADLRGYDEHLGWLHAVAHGADCVGRLGLHKLADPNELLDAVARARPVATRNGRTRTSATQRKQHHADTAQSVRRPRPSDSAVRRHGPGPRPGRLHDPIRCLGPAAGCHPVPVLGPVAAPISVLPHPVVQVTSSSACMPSA